MSRCEKSNSTHKLEHHGFGLDETILQEELPRKRRATLRMASRTREAVGILGGTLAISEVKVK